MRGQRVVRTADRFCNYAGWKAVRFTSHQQPKNLEPGRLAERGQSRKRVRGGHFVAARHRTDVADDGQGVFRI